jgi:hypothetical protein
MCDGLSKVRADKEQAAEKPMQKAVREEGDKAI